MNQFPRLHDRLLWALLLFVSLGVAIWAVAAAVATDRPASPQRSPLGDVAPFALTERSGRTVANQDLEGKTWIAAATFNCCTMSCPQIRAVFRELQDALRHTGVILVSISVDVEHDTPEALQSMAAAMDADPKRWLFLTGHGTWDREARDRFFVESFHTKPVDDAAAEPGQRIAHSSRLFLIDRKGQIRGSYRCVEEVLGANDKPTGVFQIDRNELSLLRSDANALDGGPLWRFVRLSTLPGLNATLNGTSALLLVLGYLFIRRRRIRPHMCCMIAAVSVSAVFLASYVYYHYYHGHTRFPDVPVRPVYLGILFSHVILAVLVVPLVLWTLHHAAWRNFDRHRRIARWTLPIWLYVSVTGVVVYMFLYQWYPRE